MLNDFLCLAMMKGSVDGKILKLGIIKFMKGSSLWNESLSLEIPTTWEKYGDLILFSKPSFESKKWCQAGPGLWEFICNLMKVKRIAVKGCITNDDFRSPKAKLLYGTSSTVVYKDNKLTYTWDIEKNMFCPGNVNERHRIAKIDCQDEVIVDLFAGIGYFTLPYLVHSKAKFVHACEWNPYALLALRNNLKVNGVEHRCEVHEGDCREVCPENVAHRVNLGLIPSSECGWRTACKALVEEGGILHVHHNVTSKVNSSADEDPCEICHELCDSLNLVETFPDVPFIQVASTDSSFVVNQLEGDELHWKWLEWLVFSVHLSHVIVSILKELRQSHWTAVVTSVNKVKSYAPHIDHLVFTLECRPN